MDCSKFEESVSEYLDGQLATGESKRFAEHALQCRACRALLDDIKAALRDCKEQDQLEAPVGLEAVLQMIPAEHAPMCCAGFHAIVTEFLDGFVPAQTYHRFEEHAAGCAECSALLTDVVYAVAACHSVHTYEEYDVPADLTGALLSIATDRPKSLRATLCDRVAALAGLLLPNRTATARWSFATASGLVFAMFGFLLFGFSDDMTLSGIYRQAQLKAGKLYSTGAEIYAQKDEVAARIQQVGSGIGEIWEALGGETQPESAGGEKESGQMRRPINSPDSAHKI